MSNSNVRDVQYFCLGYIIPVTLKSLDFGTGLNKYYLGIDFNHAKIRNHKININDILHYWKLAPKYLEMSSIFG